MMRLKGKNAIITGGTSGIGKATVELFLKEGANVVIADIDKKGLELAKKLTNEYSECTYFQVDVTKEEDLKNVVKYTVKKYGKLDIMFANAGIGESSVAHEMTIDDWQKIIDVNLSSVFLTNKVAIESMLDSGGGSIINNSSFLGLVGHPLVTANSAAKGGVSNLTRTLGINYAKNKIRINAICAGYVLTPQITSKSKEFINSLIAKHPIGRLAEPEEIAQSVLFLASEDSSYIIGSNLVIDGGYTAQ